MKSYEAVQMAMKSCMDNFTLTRILNHPELMYNQNPQHDKDKDKRWFKIDGMSQWVLSRTHECIICDRHAYTLVFYQRGALAANVGLKEIDDPEVIRMIKYDHAKN